MTNRSMYIWKLGNIISAEGSVTKIVEKAKRAKLTELWVKIADGSSRYSNITGGMTQQFGDLVEKSHAKGIRIWGWHVPHCASASTVDAEVATCASILNDFSLDGLIMDAEGGGEFFQGEKEDAARYGQKMRNVADNKGIPLAISSNDIPSNIAGWLPKFNKIAFHATINFPQTYYGSSPSVSHRVDRSVNGNAHVTIPFAPVGAGWVGDGGGCASASACAERGLAFINLCNARAYPTYSFWHWAGAPLALWQMLNETPV